MESFPLESGVWQQLGNQWVGYQGVCLDPTTGGGVRTTLGSPSEFLHAITKLHRQKALPSQRPIAILETSSELKKTSFSLNLI